MCLHAGSESHILINSVTLVAQVLQGIWNLEESCLTSVSAFSALKGFFFPAIILESSFSCCFWPLTHRCPSVLLTFSAPWKQEHQCNLEFRGTQHTNIAAKAFVSRWDFSYKQMETPWLPPFRKKLSHCFRELHFSGISPGKWAHTISWG